MSQDAFGNYIAKIGSANYVPPDLTGVGGGGGSGSVVSSAVDPNGVLSATGKAWCIGTGAMDGYYWKKSTVGTSNDEWVPV